MSSVPVLVVAKDSMIAALMGSLLELSGHVPVFPLADEHPIAAIRRVRPALLLLDCDHDVACEDEAYARAAAIGCKVLLFTPSRTEDELRVFARRRGLKSIALPMRFQAFGASVADALT